MFYFVVMVNLLLALTSPYVGIRQTTMECLKLLSEKGCIGHGAFAPLVKHLLQCEVEIEADQEYLKQVSIFLSWPMIKLSIFFLYPDWHELYKNIVFELLE